MLRVRCCTVLHKKRSNCSRHLPKRSCDIANSPKEMERSQPLILSTLGSAASASIRVCMPPVLRKESDNVSIKLECRASLPTFLLVTVNDRQYHSFLRRSTRDMFSFNV